MYRGKSRSLVASLLGMTSSPVDFLNGSHDEVRVFYMDVVPGVRGVLEAAVRRQGSKIGHQRLTFPFQAVGGDGLCPRQDDERYSA